MSLLCSENSLGVSFGVVPEKLFHVSHGLLVRLAPMCNCCAHGRRPLHRKLLHLVELVANLRKNAVDALLESAWVRTLLVQMCSHVLHVSFEYICLELRKLSLVTEHVVLASFHNEERNILCYQATEVTQNPEEVLGCGMVDAINSGFLLLKVGEEELEDFFLVGHENSARGL